MAKIKENCEYVASVPLSVALEMVEHPERIESPDGWGPYIPGKKHIFENGHTNINGTAMHESDLHVMNLLIIPPNLANRALARVLKKEPFANVNVLIEPVADWVLESRQKQVTNKTKWVAKSAVKDSLGELAL
jgi:hypothetical protein